MLISCSNTGTMMKCRIVNNPSFRININSITFIPEISLKLSMLKSFLYHNLIEAGCDEAGRGCLAGPVTAAAVILPKNYKHPVLNDSKKLTAKAEKGAER